MENSIRAIITGVTGMVGEGVLHECLLDDRVTSVLVLGRKPSGITHPKLKELVHPDLYDVSAISEQLSGYNACFFCLGVSSVGMKEADYTKVTYQLTMHIAGVLATRNPAMTFCYVSGSGTDSTEKGRLMWARVKGKTENDLTKLSFKNVYNFRPGILEPTKGLKNTLRLYKYAGWLAPLIRLIVPNQVSTLKQLGQAMIEVVLNDYASRLIEVKDIHVLAKRSAKFKL